MGWNFFGEGGYRHLQFEFLPLEITIYELGQIYF